MSTTTSGQKPTNGDTPERLSPPQLAAIDLLAAGATVTDAATAIAMRRQTVSEWLNQHAGFQAELNRRRWELWTAMTDKLRALAPRAIDVLAAELAKNNKNSMVAAIAVLRAAGLHSLGAPTGAITVEGVQQQAKDAATFEALSLFKLGDGQEPAAT